jgi:DNA-binding PadR family transcriptional regulator
MRRRAPWMTGYDDIILEVLEETGAVLNKKSIELNAELFNREISYSTIKRRMPKLVEAGLVDVYREKGPYYRITPLGRQYLDEQVDLSDEPEPDAGGD